MLLDLSSYYTELGGAKNKIFHRNLFFRCDEELFHRIQQFKQEYRNTDCFQCLYRYSKLGEGALLYAPFYLDLDADITSEKKYRAVIPYVARSYMALMHLGLTDDEINLYFSGSKGFHITVSPVTLGIVPSQDLNAIYKAWALYFSHTYAIPIIDLRIYDKRRLFRMPNTIHSKTGAYKVPVPLGFLYSHTYEELLAYASEPKPMPEHDLRINKIAALAFYWRSRLYKKAQNKEKPEVKYEIPKTKQELLPCIQTILEEGAIQGARNNTLIILASGLLQSGYSLSETNAAALSWNQLNEPPLDESEVLATVQSAYSMLRNGRRYGCASIRDMGLCSSNTCRIGERNATD